ncbi:MAG: Transcriptional regulator KdgR [Syntrophorhabdus sp. PtaB.Bin184]|nr:MAG: Transcriptional regulator KdgR [Syntrophorhabdus sp. PtaB.Bin184]
MDDISEKKFQNKLLERAFNILGSFSLDKKEQTLSELSRAAGLAKSTCHRLVSTLIAFGYLTYEESSKHYSLGPKLFELGSVVYDSISLRKIASQHLDDLLSRVGNKAVALAIFEDDEVVYIDRREDKRNPIKFSTTEVGRRRPPHFGMFGLLFMAYFGDDEVERLLNKYPLTALTEKSITDPVEFRKRLKNVRKLGYSFDDEGAFEDLSGVAAAIWDGSNSVVGAVGCSFISASVNDSTRQAVISAVCEAAGKVSESLSNTVLPRTIWGRR